jgi:hypothetical protein
MGEGLALPLPKSVAEKLSLGVGDCLEISGPDENGALRYTPTPSDETSRRVVRVPVRAVSSPAQEKGKSDLPSPADVARAVSGPAPGSTPAAPEPGQAADLEKELDELLAKHDAAFREALS